MRPWLTTRCAFYQLKFEDVKAAPLPGTAKPGQTGHYVNTVYSSNGLITPYSQANYPKTVVDLFEIGRAKRPDSRMFGRRKWDNAAQDWEKKLTWMSWNEGKLNSLKSRVIGAPRLTSHWDWQLHTEETALVQLSVIYPQQDLCPFTLAGRSAFGRSTGQNGTSWTRPSQPMTWSTPRSTKH